MALAPARPLVACGTPAAVDGDETSTVQRSDDQQRGLVADVAPRAHSELAERALRCLGQAYVHGERVSGGSKRGRNLALLEVAPGPHVGLAPLAPAVGAAAQP